MTPAIASEPQADPEPSRSEGAAVVEVTRQPDRDDRGPREPRRYKDNWDRDSRDRDDVRPAEGGLFVPEGIEYSQLDVDARAGLRSLPKSLAELVGKHLVAAGMLLEEDPERALKHARYARERAARVAVVREAAGIAAYHAGEWSEALSELRAVRRMSGGSTHIAVMADCERALGRPERALELAKEAGPDVDPAVAVELRIVSAGARRDMGQLDAAVVALQGADLDPQVRKPWSARLFYAYADNLEAAGRDQDAIRWFLNAAQADDDEDTDAAERAFALGADESEIAAALPGETIEIDESTDAAAESVPATADPIESGGSTGSPEAGAAPTAANAVEESAKMATDSTVDVSAVESDGSAGAPESVPVAGAGGVSAAADVVEESAAAVQAVESDGSADAPEAVPGAKTGDVPAGANAVEVEESAEAATESAAVVKAVPAEGSAAEANAVGAASSGIESSGVGSSAQERGTDRR
ncbi:tetratricopeptide repeat protein [Actinokineospora pegani]|uniref:hypothetical protein n=1 Tax=Actinokineospora pegani TaxID=2654637 RepID=UPI001F35945B|nr:hypothetical protein [Actinokineospora pegani]